MAMHNGETALITGASSGIGEELTRLFARDGYDLVLVARGKSQLEALAAQLRQRHGVRVAVLAKDLAQPGAAQAIYDELTRAGTTVDVLVNNAGYATYGSFTEIPAETELAMLQVNMAALTHLCKLFLPPMVRRGSGRVLNVAST
ncbi:MAG TPA: SDR family NAD(P)-dependent oxidoreductase, partial [Ktedonobacterales bacterium]|nr:SDR family NAD(P)-dependent oxidoreductase [Ktedonobacterales bacterium]